MPPDTSKARQKRYNAAKTQALLKEYGSMLQEVIEETIREYSVDINESTVDGIAIAYSKSQGARQAVQLLMKKLNSRASDI